MCSTPQKQPAATVALCAPSGIAAADVPLPTPFSGATPSLVVDVKGRVRRARKPGMVEVMVERTARNATVKARRVTGLSRGPWVEEGILLSS